MNTTLRYSLIIPAYNEEQYLPRLLDSVDVARERYAGGADAIEVIVANNASTDRTAEIAAARGCRVADVEERRIACARNGGAAIARGEVVCFVDADLQVHPETFNRIDTEMASGDVAGGATGFTMERYSLGIWVMQIVAECFLLRPLGMNGGVIFCQADVFREVGGYPEDRDYAEDVAFFIRMRRCGRKRGLRTIRDAKAPAIVSTRKFDRHGDWHMFYMLLWIPFRHGSLRNLVRSYWYDDAR